MRRLAGKINGRLSQPKTGGQEDCVVVGDPLEISLKGIVLDQDSIEIHNLEMLETDPTADGFGIPKNYRRWQCDQDNAGPYLMKPAVHAPRPRAMIKERGRPPANVHSLQGEITSVFFWGGGHL